MKEGDMSHSMSRPLHQRSPRTFSTTMLVALLTLCLLALAPVQRADAKELGDQGLDFSGISIAGQTDWRYSVKAVIAEATDQYVDIAILIKTAGGSTRFPISEQNYRLTYDDTLFDFYETAEGGSQDPYIVRETGHLEGPIFQDGQPVSYYSPQTVTGSTSQNPNDPPTISLNLELLSGPGLLLSSSWYEVGQIRLYFDVPSSSERLVTVQWNTDNDFPPTFVGAYDPTNGGQLVTADGIYFYGIHQVVPTTVCCAVPTSDW